MKADIFQRFAKRMPDWTLCLGACILCCAFAFAQPDHVQAGSTSASRSFDRLTDTKATQHHWKLARDYERQMRFELARQHYLLALASCRSEPTQAQLRRELESIDLQIRTMR